MWETFLQTLIRVYRWPHAFGDSAAPIIRTLNKFRDRIQLAEPKQFGRILDEVDDLLRKEIKNAENRFDSTAAEYFENLRNGFKRSLPEDTGDLLRGVDAKYSRYKVVEKAAAGQKAVEAESIFTPQQLMSAARAESTPGRIVAGKAPLQTQAQVALDTIDDLVPKGETLGEKITLPALGIGALLEPATAATGLAAGLVGVNEPARRLLTGATIGQKAAAQALRKGSKHATRAGVAVGATYDPNN